jgi:uncharacterized coiled-coil protein SlyX
MLVTLVHPEEQVLVAAAPLIEKCTPFKTNLSLLIAPYALKSAVPIQIFREFISALEGGEIKITNANVTGLSLLSTEFGFDALAAQVSEFRSSVAFAGEVADSEARIAGLEARALERDKDIAELKAEVARLSAAVNRGEAQGRALREGQARYEADAARVSSAVEGLRVEVSALKARSSRSPGPPALLPAPGPFASLVVADFPPLFAEFRGKRFTLLWRGSRDGFGADDFHYRCDGHENTLTLIKDTDRNIFGGFTPVKWDSSSGYKDDPSLKSFLFTLKNPHGVPARKFALKSPTEEQAIVYRSFGLCENKAVAIKCHSWYGPTFWGIFVVGHCNATTQSHTFLHWSYSRDFRTGLGQDGHTFFTGSNYFKVKEIEIFKITD